MALNSDLMNTQTGGEGETVQIQTQEKLTPEQFDVNIKAQETPIDSELPIQPPVQREGMVEVQNAPPSEFVEAQESFNEVPVELPETNPVVNPSDITAEDYGFLPFVDTSINEEEQDTSLPFINTDIDGNSNVFDSTVQNLNEEPLDDGVNNIIEFQKKFGLTEQKEEEKPKPTLFKNNSFFNIKNDLEEQLTDGGNTDQESLKTLGIDFNPSAAKSNVEQPLVEVTLTEEQKKQSLLQEYYNAENEMLSIKDRITVEENKPKDKKNYEVLDELKARNKELNNFLKSLDKKEDLKSYKKETEKKLAKGQKGLCNDPNASNYLSPGACVYTPASAQKDVYTYHPENWRVMDIFNTKSDYIARNVFSNRVQFKKDSQVGARYGDKIQSASDASLAVLRLFATEGDIEYYKSKGLTREQAMVEHTQRVISEYDFSARELKEIDKLLKKTVDWARSDGGVYKSGENAGKFKAALLPNWGVLAAAEYETKDGQKIKLFKGIQEDEDQKKKNKNGYGISPWNKSSFQYTDTEVNSKNNDPYFVPASTISLWEKNGMITFDENGNQIKAKGPKFRRDVFKTQKILLRRKDKDGNPYLQSTDPIWGVGLTGVMDKATEDALKRFNNDSRVNKKNKVVTDLKGTAKGTGVDYDIERDNPFYKYDKTGKIPDIAFGKVKMKDIPFGAWRTRKDAETWAAKNMPSNTKKISGLGSDIVNQSQSDFKKYIDGLGIGVTVQLEGGITDWDNVILKAPKGVVASDFILDLNENEQNDYNDAKQLERWLNSVQESPGDKLVSMWSEIYDPANAMIRNGQINLDRGNQFFYSAKDKDKKEVSLGVTDKAQFSEVYKNLPSDNLMTKGINYLMGTAESSKKGEKVIDIDKFAKTIEKEQNNIGLQISELEKKSQQYSSTIQPYLTKLEDLKKQTREEQNKINKQVDELKAKFDNDLIDQNEFSSKIAEYSNKTTLLQQNLNNAINQVNNAYKNNKGTYDEIIKIQDEIEDKRGQLTGIGSDLQNLYGVAVSDIASKVEKQNTIVGSLASSFVNGALKSYMGTANLMADTLDALFEIEGSPDSAERKKVLYQDFVKGFLKDSGLYKDPKSEGFVMQSVSSVFESLAGMTNPVTIVTAGTPLEKIGKIIGFASTAYADIDLEVSTNPNLSDLTEFQKKIITIPYSIGIGVLEDFGYGTLLRGGKSSIAKRVLTNLVSNSIKSLPKNASLELVEKAIKGEVSNKFFKLFSATANAAAGGAEEETLSAIGMDILYKNLMDYTFEKDVFNKGNTWKDYLNMTAESALGGAIGNGALGGTLNSVDLFRKNKIEEVSTQDYDFFVLTANDSKLKEIFANSVKNKLALGDIKEEDAKSLMENFENLAAIDSKISDQIDGKDRPKMASLLIQKQQLLEKAKGLDESQKGLPNPELENVESQIKEIVSRAENKINEEKKNVEENQTRVSSEVGEGQELVETQPVVETSQEEVSPGGMVQEEQTEVIPTEEVTTETETTPTEPQKITSVMTTGETQLESDLIGKDVSTGKQLKTADIQTGEVTSEFREDKNPTKGKVVNVEADPRNKNIERLILEDGTVLNRNKNTGAISLNKKVKASTIETEVKGEAAVTNEFDELADINKMTSIKKKKEAMKAFNEKYEEKATRISEIDSKFTSIVNQLKTKGIIIKKC